MSYLLETLAQVPSRAVTAPMEPEVGPAVMVVFIIFALALVAAALISLWKVFVKAGRPGWAAIVPFYNAWVLSEIAGRPGWFGLLAILISFATSSIVGINVIGGIISTIMIILISMDVAVKFGKTKAFGVVCLWLLSVAGYLLLAFGDAKYDGSTPTDTPKFGAPTKNTALPKS